MNSVSYTFNWRPIGEELAAWRLTSSKDVFEGVTSLAALQETAWLSGKPSDPAAPRPTKETWVVARSSEVMQSLLNERPLAYEDSPYSTSLAGEPDELCVRIDKDRLLVEGDWLIARYSLGDRRIHVERLKKLLAEDPALRLMAADYVDGHLTLLDPQNGVQVDIIRSSADASQMGDRPHIEAVMSTVRCTTSINTKYDWESDPLGLSSTLRNDRWDLPIEILHTLDSPEAHAVSIGHKFMLVDCQEYARARRECRVPEPYKYAGSPVKVSDCYSGGVDLEIFGKKLRCITKLDLGNVCMFYEASNVYRTSSGTWWKVSGDRASVTWSPQPTENGVPWHEVKGADRRATLAKCEIASKEGKDSI